MHATSFTDNHEDKLAQNENAVSRLHESRQVAAARIQGRCGLQLTEARSEGSQRNIVHAAADYFSACADRSIRHNRRTQASGTPGQNRCSEEALHGAS